MSNRETTFFALNRVFTRRSALQVAGAAGLAAVARPHFALAQDTSESDLPELRIVATEYAFELSSEVPAGWTRVTLDNQGAMDHHVMLLKVHDNASLADLEAALETPDFGAIFPLAESVGGAGVGPGLSSTVVIDLAPGDYVAACAIPDEDGVPHYVKGQKASFTVTEGDATGEAPTADLRITLVEMAFNDLPSDVPAGPQVWEVPNTGEQLHEMLLWQLADGVTIEQGLQMLGVGATPEAGMGEMAEMDEATPATDMAMGPPPATMVGGVAPMSPGYTNYLMIDLAAGDYIAICFIPDMETGMPHFMMGMIAGFSVA